MSLVPHCEFFFHDKADGRYIKRKAELEAKAAEAKAVKTAKAKEAMEKDELVFGGPIKRADDDPFGPPPPKKESA